MISTLTSTTLENEMDLILAYKKSIRIAELIGLAISTRTAFATAVSEVCREVIDKAFDGMLSIGISMRDGRFVLSAHITANVDEHFRVANDGFDYARRLIPTFTSTLQSGLVEVGLHLKIPLSLRVDQMKIERIKDDLHLEGPINAYEEIKLRNAELSQQNVETEEALMQSTSLNKQKNEFISMASHELNSPVTILLSYTQLAKRLDEGKEGRMTEYLNKIHQQSEKMARLVKQLLDISKIESGQLNYNMVDTSFREYLEGVFDSMCMLVPRHIVHVDVELDCSVTIDQLRIEQVITNLVSNAAKYSDPGTNIYIRCFMSEGKPWVEVRDEGIGMTTDTLQRVFEKFYRNQDLKNKYQGLGIGLYVASRIIADHNGNIYASSRPGKGSAFSFSLPLGGTS